MRGLVAEGVEEESGVGRGAREGGEFNGFDEPAVGIGLGGVGGGKPLAEALDGLRGFGVGGEPEGGWEGEVDLGYQSDWMLTLEKKGERGEGGKRD